MTYAGNLKIKTSRDINDPDAAQSHYSRLLTSGATVLASATQGPPLPGVLLGKGSLDTFVKDAASEKAFWAKAAKDAFKREPEWGDHVRRTASQGK